MTHRILIVDDDHAIRNMLEITLTIEGYDVHLAADGLEGLSQAQALSPDAIVLDVMMPNLNGHETLAALRSSPETAHIPVIMASALSADDEVWEGFVRGADSYLCKPYDIDRLVGEINRVTSGQSVGA